MTVIVLPPREYPGTKREMLESAQDILAAHKQRLAGLQDLKSLAARLGDFVAFNALKSACQRAAREVAAWEDACSRIES